jgi:hypothetical protein
MHLVASKLKYPLFLFLVYKKRLRIGRIQFYSAKFTILDNMLCFIYFSAKCYPIWMISSSFWRDKSGVQTYQSQIVLELIRPER